MCVGLVVRTHKISRTTTIQFLVLAPLIPHTHFLTTADDGSIYDARTIRGHTQNYARFARSDLSRSHCITKSEQRKENELRRS
jgi:hypothetical protein